MDNKENPGYLVLDSATLIDGTARYAGRNASAMGQTDLTWRSAIRQSLDRVAPRKCGD